MLTDYFLRIALLNILQHWLVWLHPIKSFTNGCSIPTCPYRWPDGQGDVGKFLEGEKNSKRWGNKHGRVYRIWSGMTPEMCVSAPTTYLSRKG